MTVRSIVSRLSTWFPCTAPHSPIQRSSHWLGVYLGLQVSASGLLYTSDSENSLFISKDEHPGLHRIHLRTSPCQSTEYSPFLAVMLGEHAVNYMFTHYFTAGSTVVVANAYARFAHSANAFVRHLVAMGLAPRHAAYLWTIISPEVMIPRRQRTSSTAGRAQSTSDHPASNNDTSEDGGDERVSDRVSPSSVVEQSAERGAEQSITQSTRVTEEEDTTSNARVGPENDLMEVDSDIEYIDVPYADPGEGDEDRAE